MNTPGQPNGMTFNRPGGWNARSARREWAIISQGLGSQRDIRRALIEFQMTRVGDSASVNCCTV